MRSLLAALAVAALVACGGLLVAPGNDFPCDFSKPPGARDVVCSPGDVCGVDNRCRRFRYEGPQFEGLPTFPTFADASVLHPMLIKGPITSIARVSNLPSENAFVATTAAGSVGFSMLGGSELSTFRPLDGLDDVVLFRRPDAGLFDSPLVTYGRDDGGVVVCNQGPVCRVRAGPGPNGELRASRLRVAPSNALFAVSAAPSSPVGTIAPLTSDFRVIGDLASYLDVSVTPAIASRPRVPLFLARDGFRLVDFDGGQGDAGREPSLIVPADFSTVTFAWLSSDEDATVYAAVTARNGKATMSTFAVTRTAAGFDVLPAWSDCSPCPGPTAAVSPVPLMITPGFDLSGPFVEVLCPNNEARRIRGATSDGRETCEAEDLQLPFDSSALAKKSDGLRLVVDTSAMAGFVAGGRGGQVWIGKTLGTAKPAFLDRVPTDVTVLESQAFSGLVALTSGGLYVRSFAPDLALRSNGFAIAAPDKAMKVLALVHDGRGMAVAGEGHLVQVNLDGLAAKVGYGPQLVNGRGEPVERVLAGEAITDVDGGVISAVIAADDSLYFAAGLAETAKSPGLEGQLSAVLTPEPSTLIRSFALERTPVGTNGIDRVRGYLVTSRNVYEFKLGGAPLQWTATPIRLSGAEPVEVWFDNPRGGLGRAGFRDGTVFSLPGGFQLTEALPANDAGIAATVVDYENLAGWPVALTTAGIFVARYDALPNGRLASRFPDGGLGKLMTWREVTLPDGSRPWLPDPLRREARPGKLFVLADAQRTIEGGGYRRLFHLLLFMSNTVLEIGQHERTNASALKRD